MKYLHQTDSNTYGLKTVLSFTNDELLRITLSLADSVDVMDKIPASKKNIKGYKDTYNSYLDLYQQFSKLDK